mgnify:CR=1 FL=1
MTEILVEKGVRECKEGKSCVYLLNDEDVFSQLGYKVMLSRKVPGLLNAARLRHNGQTELIYLTNGYQTYQALLPTLPGNSVFLLCSKVLETVLAIKNQGFLLPENIDTAIDRVYFDPKTYKAYLVYLPLSAGDENCEMRFNSAVRHLLVQLIKQSSGMASERERTVVETLASGGIGLEAIDKLLGGPRLCRAAEPGQHGPQPSAVGDDGRRKTARRPQEGQRRGAGLHQPDQPSALRHQPAGGPVLCLRREQFLRDRPERAPACPGQTGRGAQR